MEVVPSDPVGGVKLHTSVLDRYETYMTHLSTLVEDRSIKPADRSRLKGYLLKWKRPEILVGCAPYTEITQATAHFEPDTPE